MRASRTGRARLARILTTSATLLLTLGSSLAFAGAASAADASQSDQAPDPVTITASFAQPDINAGQTDVLSGNASYISDGTTYPLAGMQLTVSTPGDNFFFPPTTATVTTDSAGNYSYTMQASDTAGSLTWTVAFAGTTTFQPAQAQATVENNQASEIGHFHGSLSPWRVLRLDECGVIPEPEEGQPLFSAMDYQYATKRTGPWKALGSGPQGQATICNNWDGGADYPATLTAPVADGYYRAVVPEIAGEQAPSVSNVIHLARDTTKITGFEARRGARRPATVAITGRLWWQGTRFRPDAGRRITIMITYDGRMHVVGHLTTDKYGRFSGSFREAHHGVWTAIFAGTKNQFAARATTRD
jgi:hypothetical protein